MTTNKSYEELMKETILLYDKHITNRIAEYSKINNAKLSELRDIYISSTLKSSSDSIDKNQIIRFILVIYDTLYIPCNSSEQVTIVGVDERCIIRFRLNLHGDTYYLDETLLRQDEDYWKHDVERIFDEMFHAAIKSIFN